MPSTAPAPPRPAGTRRIRSSVEAPDGSVAVMTVDLDKYTPDQLDLAAKILEEHLAHAVTATGDTREAVLEHWIVELTQRHADAAAYQREAARRGVLAL